MKGWLNSNIANVLDIIMVIGTMALAFMVLSGFIPIEGTNKEIIFYIFGALVAIVTSIYNYHRGSSQGSKDKSEVLSFESEAKNEFVKNTVQANNKVTTKILEEVIEDEIV